MQRRILIAAAVAVVLAVAFVFAQLLGLRLIRELDDPPDDPADVLEWAQANNLLTAEDVEAVLGSGSTAPDAGLGRAACRASASPWASSTTFLRTSGNWASV